jgi:uncharacterized protein YebE (UPF0316 family)
MWTKLLIIFVAGIVETYMFTGWSLAANKKQAYLSSILMLTYMIVYLLILDAAFKDSNSKLMIVDYALSCALGNFIRVKQESKK